MSDKITTKIREKKKTHEGFKAAIQFDSTPTELLIEAGSSGVNVRDMRRNPNKFSFEKIVARNKNSIEFYMYPLDTVNHIFLSFKKDFFAKTDVFVLDRRRIREITNLMMRINYFTSLNKKRRLEYLRKKGFSANINITGSNVKNV